MSSVIEAERIVFAGVVGLQDLPEAHARLCAALTQQSGVTLDIGALEEPTLPFIQLVLAARASAERAGKSLHLAASANTALRAVLERGGFIDQTQPAQRRFWLGEAA